MTHARCLTLVTILSVLALSTTWTQAATFTCPGGDSACLIAAIQAANASPDPDTIVLAAGTYPLTTVQYTGRGQAYGLPGILTPVTIRGAGAQATILERPFDAPGLSIFHVTTAGRLAVSGVTLRGGVAPGGGILLNEGWASLEQVIVTDGGAQVGGGIENTATGTLTVVSSSIRENGAFFNAGGIYNDGQLTLTQSAVIGNGAGDFGGGLLSGGPATITSSTFAHNSVGFQSGGAISGGANVRLFFSTVTENVAGGTAGGIAGAVMAQGTIIAGNEALGRPDRGVDCSGLISAGHNLIGTLTGCQVTLQPTDRTGDPGLEAFVDEETPGRAHYPLQPTSQAVDTGGDGCPPTDQLGQPRHGPCDIGAVEFQHPQQAPVDVVALRQAVFLNRLGQLFVVATSSAAPTADLVLTIPGCLQDAPFSVVGSRYLFVQPVSDCGPLDGQPLRVHSSLGGMAEGVIR
jgi:hypothetical protein